ncbi:hypothetical protein M406DRAFT_72027 [Cryphonectria parasitica EP155]|uniref:Uncharacterized protein n=1 Tax=Cryphonectria parasitica (strain ATCC 38755 / EP155) TaxID=660469 RepID=A0A9P4Y8T5_CRYP1|nr:uncharacterized protein M406DRAFT_72027 [Cryphonectria parasitica EP155]KAF3769074.1 hypothetical protein M406DRAFT_72027 [Cryphonectria parasitica EP155]
MAISLPLSIVPSNVPFSLVGPSLPTTLVVDTDSFQGPSTSTLWKAHGTMTAMIPDATSSSSWSTTAASIATTDPTEGSQTAVGSVESSVSSSGPAVLPTNLAGESAAAQGARARRAADKASMAFLALCLIAELSAFGYESTPGVNMEIFEVENLGT